MSRLRKIAVQGFDSQDLVNISTQGWFDGVTAPTEQGGFLDWVGRRKKRKPTVCPPPKTKKECEDDEEFEELMALFLS